MKNHKFSYRWTLKKAKFTKDKGTVFSCFSGGGGSTMGYKLAGFDVIGCNEMDERMMEAYTANHNPKLSFCEPIQEFRKRKDLPKELFNLDLLDGSPPCCAFSIAGKRNKKWGEMRKFRSNMKPQVIDTLFFEFIALTKRLQPKIVVAENVPAILTGDAINYTRKIYKDFRNAGYYLQHFILNAFTMGVPQKRKRIFFIGLRKDLAKSFLTSGFTLFNNKPKLILKWDEPKIRFREFRSKQGVEPSKTPKDLLKHKQNSDLSIEDIYQRKYKTKKKRWFNWLIIKDFHICGTITTRNPFIRDYDNMLFSDRDYILMCSYPLDYQYKTNPVQYVVARSVPPIMMAQIATQIYKQWLLKIN